MSTRTTKPLPFWIERRMVFANLGKPLLVFDSERLLAVAKDELRKDFEQTEVEILLRSFSVSLSSDFLTDWSQPRYQKVAQVLKRIIANGDARLNSMTPYEYQRADVASVLEDCARAICFNSNAFWITANPSGLANGGLNVDVKQIRPQSLLMRKLGRTPEIVQEASLNLADVKSISGTSFSFRLTFVNASLSVGPLSMHWS